MPNGVVSNSELRINAFDEWLQFDALALHGFIVNQGLLLFDLPEQAVMAEFAAAEPAVPPNE